MESIITYGIIYLLIFRLAVLLLGGLCIFAGYRLFLVQWQQTGKAPTQNSEFSGKIGTNELNIKSAAPGIFFAAFGAGIIIAVLAGSQPNITYNEQRKSPQADNSQDVKPQDTTTQNVTVRSAPSPYSVQQDTGTTLYNRHVQALPNAIDDLSTAVELAPDNPAYHDLLARLLFVWDEPDKAIAEQQKAVQLVEAGRKEEFQARLNLYKQAATR